MSEIRSLLGNDLATKSYRGRAFRAIEDVLKADQVLSTNINTWRSRQGFDTDYTALTEDNCPAIALSPVPVPNTIDSEISMKVNFQVSVDIYVIGTCVDDALAIWEAVENSIIDSNPFRDTTVQNFLCNLFGCGRGVIKLRPYAPAFVAIDLNRNDNNPAVQMARGTLACFLRRPA